MKQLIRACPICRHSTGEVLTTTQFALPDDILLVDQYDVVACAECGCCFADTASTQAEYDQYYARHSKYEDATTSTGSALSPADAARLSHLAEHLSTYLSDRNLRIADIGCANGGLLAALKERGYRQLIGVDPSPVCVRNTQARGIDAHVGLFSRMPEFSPKLDVVIMTGVLEHVRDLDAALDSVERQLAADGYLYLGVPDAARYADFILAPYQDFNTEHINHFSAVSLNNLLAQRGYVPVAVDPHLSQESAHVEVPVLLGLYRRTGKKSEIVADRALKPSIQRYIAGSQAIMDALAAQMEAFFAEHPRVLGWGTGQLTYKLLRLPTVGPENFQGFVDGNPINQGAKLLGKTILSPAEAKERTEPILIMTTLHHAAIARRIRDALNMDNPILTFRV